jgi:putative transposase
MLLSLIYSAVRRLLRLLTGGSGDDAAREIEILVLRHQLRVLGRGRRLSLIRHDRILLAAASRLLPRELWRCFPVSPQTVLRWHRELVRCKWTYRHTRRPGRPRIAKEVTTLVLRLARENPRWGYPRIQGELKKLGISISATATCSLLRRHGLRPAPRREGPSWKEFLTQQARNLAIEDRLAAIKFLIRDRDAKYSGPFDEVFRSEGVRVTRTPIRAPRANAIAERFVRTARRECLDHILVLGERHLARVLREYVRHYNKERPHRGLSLETPEPKPLPNGTAGDIVRVARLGGLINEYHRKAA